MTVEISREGEDSVAIRIGRKDLYFLMAYLMHAKFSDEIKIYVLLSPLINEMMRAIIEFADRESIPECGSRVIRPLDNVEFLDEVWRMLTREFRESEAAEHMSKALFPWRLPDGWKPSQASPEAAR